MTEGLVPVLKAEPRAHTEIAARKRHEILCEARMAPRVDIEDVVGGQDDDGFVFFAEGPPEQRRVDHGIFIGRGFEGRHVFLGEDVFHFDLTAESACIHRQSAQQAKGRDARDIAAAIGDLGMDIVCDEITPQAVGTGFDQRGFDLAFDTEIAGIVLQELEDR